MNVHLDTISSVEYNENTTFYKVVLLDETICWVPSNPDNTDYAVVQEWLAINS